MNLPSIPTLSALSQRYRTLEAALDSLVKAPSWYTANGYDREARGVLGLLLELCQIDLDTYRTASAELFALMECKE